MCGIAGIHAYHYAANPVDPDELTRIRDHMRRRGPDAEGLWLDASGRVGLAHRRLSIIDPDPRSNQPMLHGAGELAITYNGEIYNYKALRGELERLGHRFRTASDTEVLLAMYREHGERMFGRLRGMYAFALWDGRRGALLLARDALGIKPLYFADDGWTCRVASQVKALLAGGRIAPARDPAGIVGFYLLGSVPEPYTLHQEIRAVPAGCYLWVGPEGPGEAQRHFSVAGAWRSAQADDVRAQDSLREALLDSVRHHLVADVPVGAFLSAGIDSGALVGLMRDAGRQDIVTVTVAFDEFRGLAEDESPLAAEVARAYGTRHHERRVTRAEFMADLPQVFEAMDQPSIDGVNTWFVAKAMAERGLKVALSGLGADELFGGYPSFRDIPRWVRRLALPSRIPGAARAFRSLAPRIWRGANPKLAGLLRYGGSYAGAWFLRRGLFMPWDLDQLLEPELLAEGLRRLRLDEHLARRLEPDPATPFARVSALESSLYLRNQLLRDTDWASMAHSLEVRVPYVDVELLRHCAASRSPLDKQAVARAPAMPLPAAVLGRPKTGFGTPLARWIEQEAALSPWTGVPALSAPACPWARRWSRVVGTHFAGAAA